MTKLTDFVTAQYIYRPQAYQRRIGWRVIVTLAIVVLVIVAVCYAVALAGDARLIP